MDKRESVSVSTADAFAIGALLPQSRFAAREAVAKVGYEASFTRRFQKPQPLRTLEEISTDILAIEKEADGFAG